MLMDGSHLSQLRHGVSCSGQQARALDKKARLVQ
jgi:hypothetical protein